MSRKAGRKAGEPGVHTRFARGHDPRRNTTKPGPGRTPDAIRALARDGLVRALPVLLAIAENDRAAEKDRIRALEALHKIAGLERLELTGRDGAPVVEHNSHDIPLPERVAFIKSLITKAEGPGA